MSSEVGRAKESRREPATRRPDRVRAVDQQTKPASVVAWRLQLPHPLA